MRILVAMVAGVVFLSTAADAFAGAKCLTCPRDKHGRILRSSTAKSAFKRQTGYSKGRKGYVVDHKKPLACGGADAPSNMQWQKKAAAKAKDRVERKNCR